MNTTYQTLQYVEAKPVLREKFIALNVYTKKIVSNQ